MSTKTHDDKYAALLAEYRPRPVTSAKQYKAALTLFEAAQRDYSENPTAELGSILELWGLLISIYEQEHYPTPSPNPAEVLAHLLEQRSMSQAELARQLEVSRGQVTNMLSGARSITVETAVQLADMFLVPPTVFLQLGNSKVP